MGVFLCESLPTRDGGSAGCASGMGYSETDSNRAEARVRATQLRARGSLWCATRRGSPASARWRASTGFSTLGAATTAASTSPGAPCQPGSSRPAHLLLRLHPFFHAQQPCLGMCICHGDQSSDRYVRSCTGTTMTRCACSLGRVTGAGFVAEPWPRAWDMQCTKAHEGSRVLAPSDCSRRECFRG